MPLLLRIAFLNLWRRMSRSVMVILMVALSITGLVVLQGLITGMLNQMIDNALRNDVGHVSFYQKDYRTTKALEDQIENPSKYIDFIKEQGEVVSYIDRVKNEGLVATAKHAQGALFVGTNLEEEQAHSNLKNYLIDGEYTFKKDKRGALIGEQLANKLKVDIGNKIILTTQSIDKEISSVNLTVTGIVRTNNMEIDKMGIYLNKERLRTLLGLTKQSTQIAVMIDTRQNQDIFIAKAKKAFAGDSVQVFGWTELFVMFDQIEQIQGAFGGISYGLVFVIATLGIFGVVLVSVLERVREFGIMLAIGSTFNRVRWQIITESMLLGVIGLVLGSIIGGLLLYYFSSVGIDLGTYSDAMAMFGMDAVVKAEFDGMYFVYAGLAVVLATLFAALWPIRVLKKLHPIEAINA